jgi:hypothetical protein
MKFESRWIGLPGISLEPFEPAQEPKRRAALNILFAELHISHACVGGSFFGIRQNEVKAKGDENMRVVENCRTTPVISGDWRSIACQRLPSGLLNL